ncbi:MAG: LysE family translocator [Xanthobacter sp.]
MEPASLVLFAVALALAAALPGPAVVALVARTLARGRTGTTAFISGIVLGDVIWLATAVLGLAALAATLGPLFTLVRLAGAAYLLFLAWRLWTARGESAIFLLPAEAAQQDAPDRKAARKTVSGFLGGLALTLGNPKTIAFYLALLPTLLDMNRISLPGFLELSAIIALVLLMVLSSYVYLADKARRFIATPRAIRLLNRLCGTAMAGAAVSVATR